MCHPFRTGLQRVRPPRWEGPGRLFRFRSSHGFETLGLPMHLSSCSAEARIRIAAVRRSDPCATTLVNRFYANPGEAAAMGPTVVNEVATVGSLPRSGDVR